MKLDVGRIPEASAIHTNERRREKLMDAGVGTSLGERIRTELENRIVSGEWPVGHRIPSEHDLMAEFACSRMTMNKVLSGIASRGLITRRRGAGSYVAAPGAERAIMEIQDFSALAGSGRNYHHEILHRKVKSIGKEMAAEFDMQPGSKVLHIECLHVLDNLPHAYEDRIISLASTPAARNETFEKQPPGTWLLTNVPWTQAEHTLCACNAGEAVSKLLHLTPGTACLVLERRTWRQGSMVTRVTITYPGDRHRFVGRFSPTLVQNPYVRAV